MLLSRKALLSILALGCIIAIVSCNAGKKSASTGSAGPLTNDTLHRISSQFVFTEGPAVDKNGDIYFTDQPRDQIWKFDASGQLGLFMEKTGRSNGLYIASDGSIISAADEKNELWSINKSKQLEIRLKAPSGKAFNGPNDLWIDQSGGIYFTDPYYQRDYWTRKKPELLYQGLYYLPRNAREAILLDSTMAKPNGIVGTPDGKYLYVADIGANKTYRYRIGKNGLLHDRKLFVEKGSDGMTLDNHGNLYITGKGVTAFNSDGMQIWHLPVPSSWVGNLCFGGADRTLLFITASESVYTIRMNVRGVE